MCACSDIDAHTYVCADEIMNMCSIFICYDSEKHPI